MDKEKILRLLDEADDIVSALYRQAANKDYKCKSLREKLKAIAAEITAPPKSNGDRIRHMDDGELREFICHNTNCQTCGFWLCGCDLERWLAAEHDKEDIDNE